jgi:hypothetical protein
MKRSLLLPTFLALFLSTTPACKFGKTFLYIARPFTACAIKGQDPKPASEEERAHFVSQETLLRDVTYLSAPDCEGREVGTKGNALAREYIKKRMSESGLSIEEQSFVVNRKQDQTKPSVIGVNVLGMLPGTNPTAPWIVISAHYDHLGYSKEKGDFYPGADDNAAGVAALFELAKYFSQHKTEHPILFIAFDAEELGSIGASRFLEENPTILKQNIAFDLNLDMISRSHKKELFAVTHYVPEQKPLRDILFSLQSQVGFKLLVGRDDTTVRSMASDHEYFLFEKIPFVYFGVADHEDYHRVSDKVQKIDRDFYTAVVDCCVLLVQRLDGYLPLALTPKPGD